MAEVFPGANIRVGTTGFEEKLYNELRKVIAEIVELREKLAELEGLGKIGDIKIWPSATIPTKCLKCEGQEISRTTFKTLFELIGTTFGEGNKSTTFNLPNLNGRVPVGVSGTFTLGKKGGVETVTLTIAEIPAHGHNLQSLNFGGSPTLEQSETVVASQTGGGSNYTLATMTGGAFSVGYTAKNTGGGGAHTNLQPYLALNFVIRVE